MPEKVRVGIVGTSWWADLMHLPSLKSHPQADLAAICGRNREHTEEMAKKYGIPVVFTDYRELIEKGDLQALVIAAPDDQHYPMVMNALDAGLHVVCEKPIALNTKQAREMCEKAETAGVKHMIYFTGRWMPHFRYLKQLIDEGYIGRCFHCHIHQLAGYGRSLWDSGSDPIWRFDRKRALGILGDLGSHLIDRAMWFVGDIARVSASVATFADQMRSDDRDSAPANNSAILTLEFANGAQGVIHASAVAHVGDREQQHYITLHGESGTLEMERSVNGSEIRGLRHDDEKFRKLTPPDELFGDSDRSDPFGVFSTESAGDRYFIDAILGDKPVSPNFRDALRVEEIIEAAFESHRSGRWVLL